MPTALEDTAWGQCLVAPTTPPRALADTVRRQVRVVPAWVGRLAPAPWVPRMLAATNSTPVTALPVRLWDLVGLLVSRDNSCRYCYGVQRAFMRVLGYREAEIEALELELDAAALTPAERVALGFARRVSRASPRPSPADREALLRAGFSPLAIAELAFAAASTIASNRIATLIALPSETFDSLVNGPVGRLLLPVVGPLLARRFADRQKPPAPPPEANGGHGAAVVAALAGSPAALVVRRALDEAIASPILPPRTKLLLLAVVARALACDHGEAEARDALDRLGMPAVDVAEVLAHLSSPCLTSLEARLVPFARETVRCKPAAIQERMRAVTAGLSPAEIVETAGVLALGNAICRLSVLLEIC